ncbi:hypothetical protein JB92DRAFT_3051032 [Gautieria morchelliformis]|nr:hypothetical protein JB92DRAFT_3051032 [Gautieria morchelliformis]
MALSLDSFQFIYADWAKYSSNNVDYATPMAPFSSSGAFVSQSPNSSASAPRVMAWTSRPDVTNNDIMPYNRILSQSPNCSASAPRTVACTSRHDVTNNEVMPYHRACNSEPPFPPNMLGLSNPDYPVEGSTWPGTDSIDGNHNSFLQLSGETLSSINDPVYPTSPTDQGYDAQAYYQGSDPSNDLDHSPPVSSVSTPTSPTSHTVTHTITRLPSCEIGVVDAYLERQDISGIKKWTCHFTGCTASTSWRNKDAARNHVYKHLNQTKLFKCVECNVSFASEKNAVRHCHRGRSFPCNTCARLFARVDYRNKHQKSCGNNA